MARRVAVVTGSSQGGGRAVAEGLAQDDVAGLDNGPGSEVERVVEAILDQGGEALGVRQASDTYEGVHALMEAALSTFGQVDIWVNSLGFQQPEPLLSMSAATWDQIIRVQLTAVFLGTQCAAQQMVRQGRGGRILNVVGGGAYGGPGASAHAASKGGALAATYSWASELRPYGITVNGIRGGVQSPGMRRFMAGVGLLGAHELADDTQLRNLGFYRRDEAWPLAVWLASDAARDITGLHIGIDGGRVVVYSRVGTEVDLTEDGSWTADRLDRRLKPGLLS